VSVPVHRVVDHESRSPTEEPPCPRGALPIRVGPSSDDVHEIVFFQRAKSGDPAGAMPGREFLATCPTKVRATMRAVLVAVASAPPKRFSGGGYWESMKGDMKGWFEVRVDGPQRRHYRLFCGLDYEAKDQAKPLLVVIDGRSKPFRTELSAADYLAVRVLGDEYLARNPWSID
jgi:hypothetical protein